MLTKNLVYLVKCLFLKQEWRYSDPKAQQDRNDLTGERDWSAFLILEAPLAPEWGSKLEIQNF